MPQETVRSILETIWCYKCAEVSRGGERLRVDEAIASLHKLMLEAVGEDEDDTDIETFIRSKLRAEVRAKIDLLFAKGE
jgi:hypothetical protein